ncbi:unnamed protein product, partial [Hydatigera taeniaeformis]|uniref:Fibronectin type-III domain-containing protein n=1 Tax=Hydatigena taeniaeformis TaxID=6205 RepID=A0A0R3X6D4_HYDTA
GISIHGLEPYATYSIVVEGRHNGAAVFNLERTFRTWPTAPISVSPPTGRAKSTSEIELHWFAPTQLNGILKPYLVVCFDLANPSFQQSTITKDNASTSVIVGNLRPGIEYRCSVVTRKHPGLGQDSKQCSRASDFSAPIRTMALAPSRVSRPRGMATSPTEIQLTWSKPKHPNGILKPYRVVCRDVAQFYAPSMAITKDNETTSVIVKNLHPDTTYQCLVVASTIAAVGQDPLECERLSNPSNLIRTKSQSALLASGN